jgi:hypothetical protein
MWILFYFFSIVSDASCLPTIKQLNVPASYFSCTSDADCEIYQDACRSCGDHIVTINKKFSEVFKKIDYESRQRAKCVLSCEACATADLKPKCLKNKCTSNK